MSTLTEVLDFWFGKPTDSDYGKPKNFWFQKNSEFDKKLKSRFLTTYQKAARGDLNYDPTSPQDCLAVIIILDQFPRNLFRGTPQAFACDAEALKLAKYVVKQGLDRQLLPVQRWFIYLPYEHSEDLDNQSACMELFSSLADDENSQSAIAYAQRHYDVIQRFGRFPHRNSILGRKTTPEEQEFLNTPGSSF